MPVTKNTAPYATYALVGSFAFWLPSVILHSMKGDDSFRHLTAIAFVQLLSTLGALAGIWFLRARTTAPREIAPWMLLGIWMLGPVWLFINATFIGGGFAKEGSWLGVIISILLFPIMTPLFSVYEGSIVYLGVITLVLGLVCVDLRR